MYSDINFKSKAELKRAVAAGERVTVFQVNGDLHGSNGPYNGEISIEGPHYPRPRIHGTHASEFPTASSRRSSADTLPIDGGLSAPAIFWKRHLDAQVTMPG